MDYMTFITNNYIWFIVGGIVIIMIVIGYFAEKTDFGRKSLNETKREAENPGNTSESESIEQPQIKLEGKGINDILGQNTSMNLPSFDVSGNETAVDEISIPEESAITQIPEEPVTDEIITPDIPNVVVPEEEITIVPEPKEVNEVQNNTPEIAEIPEILDDSEEDNEDDVWKF